MLIYTPTIYFRVNKYDDLPHKPFNYDDYDDYHINNSNDNDIAIQLILSC